MCHSGVGFPAGVEQETGFPPSFFTRSKPENNVRLWTKVCRQVNFLTAVNKPTPNIFLEWSNPGETSCGAGS